MDTKSNLLVLNKVLEFLCNVRAKEILAIDKKLEFYRVQFIFAKLMDR